MSVRIVHLPDGVMVAMHTPDFVDRSIVMPRKPQRAARKPGGMIPRPRFVELPSVRQRPSYGPRRLITGLAFDGCRWPLRNGWWCGAKSKPEKPYCEHHDDVAHGHAQIAEAAE